MIQNLATRFFCIFNLHSFAGICNESEALTVIFTKTPITTGLLGGQLLHTKSAFQHTKSELLQFLHEPVDRVLQMALLIVRRLSVKPVQLGFRIISEGFVLLFFGFKS